ncbi:hypothetical protein [Paludibaculum fermentans]|uniref:Uncharacterized protein n=1 Tax=Paludibaculum fermentans TaxID=1473598 RepID=A0A7S7NRJ7_PALFE|nr:hypothetical protein [Paludibaculum fermentans]QOY88488.1 hypothetical protein IRI77_00550 [Paludibaculum fermentans]
MSRTIRVDRKNLYYADGSHELILPVEWSAVAKTDDCPIDFEIIAGELACWTAPSGAAIEPALREELLNEIADYYSKGPVADIIGPKGSLLRGASTFRFYLQIPPVPSRYYEAGRFLEIPMAQPANGARAWNERYILDFTGVRDWTSPRLPLDSGHLKEIARRIVAKEHIGVRGLPD